MNFAGGALLEAGISCIVQKLGDFVVGRSQQFLEIADDINWIKEELSMMKASLKDAERRMETSEACTEWVKQLKSAAFMMEDFMDEYVYVEQGIQVGSSSNLDKMQMVQKVKDIKNKVTDISRRSQAYGIHLTPSSGLGCNVQDGESSRGIHHRPVHSSPFEEVEDIVGFDEDVSKLMNWLLTEEEKTGSIISIVGMGGSGKTTLAKKVYSLVQNQFDHHFWVTASQYSPSQSRDFSSDTIKGLCSGSTQSRCVRQKFTGNQDKWVHKQQRSQRADFPKAVEDGCSSKSKGRQSALVRNSLQQVFRGQDRISRRTNFPDRYLLIIDDINYPKFLQYLFAKLPVIGKIILTSREIITNCLVNSICHVHMLNPLPFELGWDLFCRNAFPNCTPRGNCPSYLYELGATIVRRCSGLPLAIVLMGCLMSNKGDSPREWNDVVDHFDLELLHNPGLERLNWVLQASYNHLPSQLKYCFLYCCLFPKHHRIKRKKATQLWVAQMFVEKRGKPLEDVADDYFIQLIERSFLQPIISEFTGEIIACTVHEVMHNFAISKFPEEFGILTKEPCNECEQKRHLALQNYRIPCKRQHGKARSFLFFDFAIALPFCYDYHDLMDELLSHKFLMVLSLDGMAIEELPSKLGDLFHLRYLSLKKTKIEVLPYSLGKLNNLETLDVRDTRIQSIPTNLENLRKLRHLFFNNMKVYSTNGLVIMPTSIGNFEHLQTLLGVEVDDNFIRDVCRLEQLRNLYIRLTSLEHSNEPFLCTGDVQHCPEYHHKQLFASITEIKSLRSLKVESLDKEGKFTPLGLETSFPLPAYLEKLALGGVIMKLPSWFGHLRSLRVLVLINSLLKLDPLSELAELPNLVSLKLIHAYTGEQMGCGPRGFLKLRHLHMASLVEFEEWIAIAEGAMPCIQFLSIIDCKKLTMLPEGFERLKTLQSLEVFDMSSEFIERLKREDNSKIQRIPKKTIY